MEFKIIRDEQGFLAERENWTKLYAENKFHMGVTPFQSFEWCYAWWKHREDKDSLFIIKAYTCEKIEGYAPLIIKNKMVEFIGGRDMDYGRFLINDCVYETILCFINVIKENGYGFALQEMASRDTQLHIVQRILEKEKKYLLHQTTRTMFVETANFESYDNYLNTLSGALRKKLKKFQNKLNMSIEIEDFDEVLKAEISDIYLSRQTVRGGNYRFDWALSIIEKLSACKSAQIYIARIEGKAVAYSICLLSKNRKFIWLSAFHMDYENTHIGKILRNKVIYDAFIENYQSVDFMRGDYDFKTSWNAQIDTNYTVYVFPKRTQLWKNKFKFWIRPKLKKIVYGNKTLKKWYKKHAK